MKLTLNLGRVAGFKRPSWDREGMDIFWKQHILKNSLKWILIFDSVKFDLSEVECGGHRE